MKKLVTYALILLTIVAISAGVLLRLCPGKTFHRDIDKTVERDLADVEGQNVILGFTFPWCEACRVQHHGWKWLQDRGWNVRIIDITKHPEVAKKFKIKAVPTTIVVVKGTQKRFVWKGRLTTRLQGLVRVSWLILNAPECKKKPKVRLYHAKTRSVNCDRCHALAEA